MAVVWGPSSNPADVDAKAAAAEFIALILFVIIGCGTACGNGAGDGETRMVVAMAFGMGILILAYTIGHHSGGQINSAVTVSLMVGKKVSIAQGLANIAAQMLGSVFGAMFLCIVFPCAGDLTGSLGTNMVNPDYGAGRAWCAEVFGTFLLCFVVWEVACNPKSAAGNAAPIAIGFTVFLAHVLLLPIDGCSINPSRSFGPALVGHIRNCPGRHGVEWEDMAVVMTAPFVGAVLAALVKIPFDGSRGEPTPKEEVKTDTAELIEEGAAKVEALPSESNSMEPKESSKSKARE